MENKKCFKCGKVLPLTEFYKHPKMADGRVNKCKDCNKKDVRENYEKNIENPEYIERERLRGRIKYAKYKYRSRRHTEGKLTHRRLKTRGINMENKEAHHWNYNLPNSVFVMNKRTHKFIHKHLKFDKETKMFKTTDGELLKSQNHHYIYICKILMYDTKYDHNILIVEQ